jgi:hypothetical protein
MAILNSTVCVDCTKTCSRHPRGDDCSRRRPQGWLFRRRVKFSRNRWRWSGLDIQLHHTRRRSSPLPPLDHSPYLRLHLLTWIPTSQDGNLSVHQHGALFVLFMYTSNEVAQCNVDGFMTNYKFGSSLTLTYSTSPFWISRSC